MIKALIFDLDGTLVDSAEDLCEAANLMLGEHGLAAIDLATVRQFIGNGMGVLVERCFAYLDAPPVDLAAAIRRYKTLYQQQGYPNTRLFAGAGAALAQLGDDGYRLALCTNKDERMARAILDRLGIADLFDSVIGGDSTAAHKPDPRPLLAAAAGCGADIDSLFYVGDSEIDAEVSRRTGAPLLLYTQGYRKTTPEQLAPFAQFDDFAELPALVARLART